MKYNSSRAHVDFIRKEFPTTLAATAAAAAALNFSLLSRQIK